MKRFLSVITFTMCLGSFGSFAHAEDSDAFDPLNVFGQWKVQSGGAAVDIQDCGDGTPCGAIIWIDAPNPELVLDYKNPDPEKHTNPMLGTQIVWGFRNDGHEWDKGQIYDAEGGKVYKSEMRLREDGTLKVKGCLGMFCRSQTWTRFDPSIDTPSPDLPLNEPDSGVIASPADL